MGLFSKIMGGGGASSSSARALLAEEARVAEEEQAKADALKLKQAEDRRALKVRGQGMQGGGRAGLMFSGNKRGVD